MAVSALMVSGLLLTYKSRKFMILCLPLSVLLACRQANRILDIEGIKPLTTPDPARLNLDEWGYRCLLQVIAISTIQNMRNSVYQGMKLIYLITLLESFFIGYCYMYAFSLEEKENELP
jgi:hypothetical protein